MALYEVLFPLGPPCRAPYGAQSGESRDLGAPSRLGALLRPVETGLAGWAGLRLSKARPTFGWISAGFRLDFDLDLDLAGF